MDERQEEISCVVDIINKFCIDYNIALIPCETKNGTKYVGILDNTTGTTYAIINEK